MRHLAVIMDGNGRWAKERDLPVRKGHEQGARALMRAIADFCELDIDVLTVYALSAENLKRDREEVSDLLGIIAYFLSHDIAELAEKNDLKLRFIGDFSPFAESFCRLISDLNARFINNGGKTVVFAIGYGGDREIRQAFDRILKRRAFLSDYSPVSDEELQNNLYTAGLPAPDAIVRYGGYKRLSNFLPLQSIYSELFFLDKYWCDYERGDFEKIIGDFAAIKRNFGGRNG